MDEKKNSEHDVHKRPSSARELGRFKDRLKMAIGDSSVLAFSRLSGVHEASLRKYLAGDSEPTMGMLVRMGRASGRSIEWLATGQGDPLGKPPREKIDVGRLETAIRVVEDYLGEHDLVMKPEKKAQAIEMLYERFIDWEGSPDALQRLMKLAS